MLKFIVSAIIQEAVVWLIKETVYQYKLESAKKSGDPGRI